MTATEWAVEQAVTAARAAADRKATDIVALDVTAQLALTDVFVLASGASERQVLAIADAVEEALRKADVKPIRQEGQQKARWILLDFGDVIVHVQHIEDREFYGLERLWKDCPAIELPADARGDDDARVSEESDGAIRLAERPAR